MIVVDIPQMSEEWFSEKAGRPGSSSFSKIITTKGEPSKQAQDYIYQLAGEAIVGRCEEGYTNWAMQEGVIREAESRELFEIIHGPVRQVGVVYKDENKAFLCSPDGLKEDSGLELKNPLLKTHVKYLLSGKLPIEYFQQVQGSMYVTDFTHWYFMSYYPGMLPFILKVERDEKFISKLAEELERFCYDLAVTIRKLKEMK